MTSEPIDEPPAVPALPSARLPRADPDSNASGESALHFKSERFLSENRVTLFGSRSGLAALPTASLFLCTVIGLTFIDVFAGWRPAAFIAVPFLAAYFAWTWRIIIFNGRVLLSACALIGVIAALRPGAIEILYSGASRMIYLPSFVALLGLLRAAAGASATIAVAGRHLVNQPPSRRYIALSFGGHFFGILLNIGGLALLIEMVRDANTLEAAGGNAEIVAWRERRMTAAALRGFAAMPFWSPLGVSFNLLLVSIPGLTWSQAGPIGIFCAAAFIALGWVFDQFQRPKGLRPRPIVKEPGGAQAVAAVTAHVVAVTALTWAVELVLRLPFQTALLLAVPAYAFCWALAQRYAQSEPAPFRSSAAILTGKGIAAFGSYANEIAVFAASGFLGAVLAGLIPHEAIQSSIQSLAISPGIIAAMLCVAVALLGFFGLNPMIASTILASTVSAAEIPGLPNAAIVLSIAAGWACTVVASPMNSALVMTSIIVGRRPWTVAVTWNGLFALTALVISTLLIAVVLSL